MDSTNGKVLVTLLGNVYQIILVVDFGTELGSLDGFLMVLMMTSLRAY